MYGVEQQEEGTLCERMLNPRLHWTVWQLGKQLDIGFVVVSYCDKHLELKLFKLFGNFLEMLHQSCAVQSHHRWKANQVTVTSSKRADQKWQQSSGWAVLFIAEVAAAAVIDLLGGVDLEMHYKVD